MRAAGVVGSLRSAEGRVVAVGLGAGITSGLVDFGSGLAAKGRKC